jgi:hypothetical protein
MVVDDEAAQHHADQDKDPDDWPELEDLLRQDLMKQWFEEAIQDMLVRSPPITSLTLGRRALELIHQFSKPRGEHDGILGAYIRTTVLHHP